MIHGEAPSRLLKCNRKESCFLKLGELYNAGWSSSQIANELNSRFDLVVFSMANAIRPGFDIGSLLPDVLDQLEIDFIVLGLGMQEPIRKSTEDLHPNLLRFLGLSNRKAKIFAVRGMETENWLKTVGFDNALALGCPSLFVYPQNIMKLAAPDPRKVKTAVTAGYISAKIPRSSALISLFNNFKAHYVMQQEMFFLKSYFTDCKLLYNDATGEVDKELLNIVFERIHNRKMPFVSYRWFQDPHAWRVFVSHADVYIGDRFHCGVASLQAGTPAVIIADDLRVRDMTDFFKIPNISVKEAKHSNVKKLVTKYLSEENIEQLKEVYSERFDNFKQIMNQQNIQLVSDIEQNSKDIFSVMEKSAYIPKSDLFSRLFRRANSFLKKH